MGTGKEEDNQLSAEEAGVLAAAWMLSYESDLPSSPVIICRLEVNGPCATVKAATRHW